jgi:hypothetical protein
VNPVELVGSNTTIKCLPPSPIVYSSSSRAFKWEAEVEGKWGRDDFVFFYIPQLVSQFQLNCVAESRTLVVTASVGALRDDPNAEATNSAMAELRAVVGAIREARPLPTQPELDELLMQAAASQGTPGDLVAWAHQLAEDIAGLTD